MLTNLLKIAYKYQMDSDCLRIKQGKKLDITKKPYQITYIDNMIKYYEDLEIFENCEILLSFKKDKLDHEKNYEKK